MRFTPADTAALAIDFQARLLPVIHENRNLRHYARTLLLGLQQLDIPILVTEQYRKGLGSTVPEIEEAVASCPHMEKETFGAYDDPQLKGAIDGLGKRNFILCGVEAHICVLQTALGLREAGYQVCLAADCVGSRFPLDRDIALRQAQDAGIRIATCEAVLFELLGRADTPAFKAISQLIK